MNYVCRAIRRIKRFYFNILLQSCQSWKEEQVESQMNSKVCKMRGSFPIDLFLKHIFSFYFACFVLCKIVLTNSITILIEQLLSVLKHLEKPICQNVNPSVHEVISIDFSLFIVFLPYC